MDNDRLDAVVLETRIPEGRQVTGLEYGEHVNRVGDGWCGYYVRPIGGRKWGIGRHTPASDELIGDDAAIVAAIRDELK